MSGFLDLALCSLPNGRFFLGIGRSAPAASGTAGYALNSFFETPFAPAGTRTFTEDRVFATLAELQTFLSARWPAFRAVNGSETWPVPWQAADEKTFSEDFARIQTAIAGGRLQKAVPATFERAEGVLPRDQWDAFHAWAVQRLLGAFGAFAEPVREKLYVYAAIGEDRAICGLSPELLLSNSSAFGAAAAGEFVTMALAGSAPLTRDDADFLADPKERAEHEWVVRDLEARAEALGVGMVRDPLRVEHYPKLKHLKTPLRWRTGAGFDPVHAVTSLHPTPALGVQPRSAESEALLRSLLSSRDRGYLGAPITFRNGEGLFHSVVAIRGFERRGDSLHLGAGCGVVGASVRDREFAECALKRASTKALFGW